MTILFHILNCPPVLLGRVSKNKTLYRRRSNLSVAVQISSVSIQTDDSKNLIESKKILSPGMALKRSQTPNSLLRQPNTIGVIGGVSVYSTLIFLEKLVRWSSRDGQECVPFVVCSDPALSKELPVLSSFHSFNRTNAQTQFNHGHIVGNLQQKRLFLEQSGACCIVLPCHLSHVWHSEVSKGCSLPFLHVGDCVARELSKANLRPLEAGSNVRIGVLATGATLKAGVYQEKLQSQGFEVVLPDQATMHHIIIPAIEAFNSRDIEGARNLLRIAIQVLLVRAVNTVILASDETQGLLPHDDPLLKKCIDPMDALARSTIRWATSTKKIPSSPVVSEGKVDIPDSFEDDLSDDCENVTAPIATPSPSDTPLTKESCDGASEGLAGVTGHLVVSNGVDIAGDVPNMELVTAETSVGATFGMNIEVPVDATIVAASQVAPVPVFLDSLILNSSEEHIEAFLDRFEQDRNNEHEASHFYNFVGPSTSIHRFSIPSESIPLLEHLRARHNDFIGQLTVGSAVGNPLLRILAAVLMDMQGTQVAALTEKRLFEWRDAVRDLHKAGLEVYFILHHLRGVAKSWFRRDVKARLACIAHRISELEAELAMLKSEMVQLQRDIPDAVTLDNNAIHGLL